METQNPNEPEKQLKPKCPICGGALRYRWKTDDYACTTGPHKFPASQLTPLAVSKKNPQEETPGAV